MKKLLIMLFSSFLFGCLEEQRKGIVTDKEMLREEIQQTIYIDGLPNNTLTNKKIYVYWIMKVQYENHNQKYYVTEKLYNKMRENDTLDANFNNETSIFQSFGKELLSVEKFP